MVVRRKRCLSGGKIWPDERKEFFLPLLERGNVVLYRVAKNKPEGIKDGYMRSKMIYCLDHK